MTLLMEDIFAGAGFVAIDASPLQRAICRASEGYAMGDELDDAAVEAHFGCPRSGIGLAMPVLVQIVAGVRSGKSFWCAAGAVRDVFVADCSGMKAHEVARHAIVGPSIDNAEATFQILRGIVETSPLLQRMLVEEPTKDTVVLRRPDGRVFEIVVVAAHRGGMTLRSRWLAGATLEEVALFGIESQGNVVNAEELLRAAESRLLPRTQVRIVSSPMGRQGLLWQLFKDHFGKPGRVLVVHAPTQAMNPAFPRAAIDAVRARDPDAAAREFDARWIDGDVTFLDSVLVELAVREGPLARLPQMVSDYEAAMDGGTRGNAWTLAVARPTGGVEAPNVEISMVREWKGSKDSPLSPDATFKEIATLLRPYRVSRLHCDRWSFDANRDLARRHGLELVEHGPNDRDAANGVLRTLVASKRLELPPVEAVAADLKMARKILTPTGFRVELPRTADGRHCDFVPSIALATWRALALAPVDADVSIFVRNSERGGGRQGVFEVSGGRARRIA